MIRNTVIHINFNLSIQCYAIFLKIDCRLKFLTLWFINLACCDVTKVLHNNSIIYNLKNKGTQRKNKRGFCIQQKPQTFANFREITDIDIIMVALGVLKFLFMSIMHELIKEALIINEKNKQNNQKWIKLSRRGNQNNQEEIGHDFTPLLWSYAYFRTETL